MQGLGPQTKTISCLFYNNQGIPCQKINTENIVSKGIFLFGFLQEHTTINILAASLMRFWSQ